jgi:YVTN family beta-propeller protein
MAPRESSSSGPARSSRRFVIAGAAVLLAAGGTVTALAGHHSAGQHPAAGKPAAAKARLAASSCTGPAGTAYIALPGYQAFDAVDSSDCYLVQQYNVADGLVPNTGTTDTSYDSTDEGVAIYGTTLYFADTGNDTVAVLPTTALTVSNYANPTETLIHVGTDPENLAVTPDGSQVWAADTGPQTGLPSKGAISVISTATNTVTATLHLPTTDPRRIAFSPSGAFAYVTTSQGLYVFSTANHHLVTVIRGLGDPEDVTVSPDGSTVYVTNTVQGVVDVISAAANRVTRTIRVGELPWQLALSSGGSTLYVANGDSNSVSVISTASDTVTSTIAIPGDPVSVALTPDGSELWVGGLTSAIVTVIDTANGSTVGSFNVGYGGEPNSGDGDEPTGIVLTSALPPGSTSSSAVKGAANSKPAGSSHN